MYWSTLRAAILAKLNALPGGTVGLVYNGEQDQQAIEVAPASWPIAELVRIQTEPDYLTNREDMEAYIFAINLYAKWETTNGGEVEVAMDTVVDTVMNAFFQDATLGGVVDARITPIQSASAVLAWQGVVCRRDTIFLRCRKIVSMD